MLHTEYALASGLDDRGAAFCIDMAHLLLSFDRWSWENRNGIHQRRGELGMVDPELLLRNAEHARAFLPHWYAVACAILLTRGMTTPAHTFMEEALKMWPADPLLLYYDGVVKEFDAVWHPVLPHDPNALLARALRDTGSRSFDASIARRNWGPADAAYRKAVSKDPENAEAHLHLGYVLLMLGDASAARTELDTARGGSKEGHVLYLAGLFLGRLKESQGDLPGAVEEYERALGIGRFCQTPYVALSAVHLRLGNRARARELIATLASIRDDQRVPDPWWAYHTSRIPAQDLQWLREQTRQ